MFRLALYTIRPLRLAEFHQALTIPDGIHTEFSPSDESFGDELIQGINKRIIHCTGNFIEIKGASGTSSLTRPIVNIDIACLWFVIPNDCK